MKNMKQLFCILLCVCLLTACNTFEKDSYFINIRSQIQNTGKLFGVAYLGNVEGDYADVQNYIGGQEYVKVYPFLQEISKKSFVQNEGNELYCVIPADDSVTLHVYKAEAEMSSESSFKKGEELITVKNGNPVLIRGNISDIMPNLMIVANRGDEGTEYSPCISLKNGLMDNSEQKIFEFTPYELMNEFNGMNPETQWGFCGNWTSTVTEFNGETYQLDLSLSSDGCVELSFASETVSGSYTGNWLILSDQRLRLELGGEAKDSEIPGVSGLHTDVDGIYYWDVKDGSLILTYINGTPFYPAATVTEFPFVPVN